MLENPSSRIMVPGFSNFNFEGTNAGNESECSFNSGSSFPAADRTASLPAVRRRPRLAKVRKPHHSRSSMPTVDFNPFLSGSDRSTDDFSATNGFCNSGSGSHKLGESQNTVFVFCSSRSDNSADGDSIGNICGVKTDDRNECLNSDNLGYVFGPRITCSSYMSGKEAGSQTKLVSDDKLNYNGLDSIVDAYDSDSISSLSSENGGSGGNVEHFVGVDEERVELGCRRENEKFDSLGFVFCARSNKSAENSTIEKNFLKILYRSYLQKMKAVKQFVAEVSRKNMLK
ncbi:hypothetical protein Nepgr_020538 [Nepenthes gracilis]|uniref:Uncharacterized protein n=1 Tax=Nepenthes gracilis TaxID=150966 RepID=A0AAD3SX50_NEPGR|nr:hypothetical protein Nepgr_020538 [Nepenthes gracilis]